MSFPGGETPNTSPDAQVLAQLAGAAFFQNADFELVLPSGETLDRDAARVFSELERTPGDWLNLDRPPIVGIGEYLPGDYVLSLRRATHDIRQEKLKVLKDVTEIMAPNELLDATEAFAGSLDLEALQICIDTAREQRDAATSLGLGVEADDYSNVATVGEFESARIRSSHIK